jgi:predicted component of type VI protein secretion system
LHADQLANISLEITNGSGNPSIWPMPQCMAIAGRASACVIRAADERLSTYHCSFVKTANGLWVLDLLSEGGTRVNGELARAARLRDGDIVRAGPVTVVVRADSAPIPPSVATYSAESSAMISLPHHQPAEPPHSELAALPETIKETVTAMVTPMHDLMKQFQECLLVMSKMFTNVQEQQLAMARDQFSEFQLAARDFARLIGNSVGAFAEELSLSSPIARGCCCSTQPTAASDPPPPKPLAASAANGLPMPAWLTSA